MFVHFKDVYAYATDAHIVVRQKLSISFSDLDTIDNLEGKYIHREVFKELFTYDIIKAESNHVMAYKGSVECKFSYTKGDGWVYPNIEAIIPTHMPASVDNIALNYKLLNTLSSAMTETTRGVNIKFYGANKAIKVTSNSGDYEESDQLGIIMPLMINE